MSYMGQLKFPIFLLRRVAVRPVRPGVIYNNNKWLRDFGRSRNLLKSLEILQPLFAENNVFNLYFR